ncbi:MAG: RNA methyltransferase [Muribaculaceae bacterium]
MELSKNIIKLVSSLAQKKYRVENNCFAAEGTKCVRDTWDYFNCRMIISTQEWYEQFGHSGHLDKIMIATKQQMSKMSQFSTPSDVIAIYDIPKYIIDDDEIKNSLSIVLDSIQDPGNLGTIIRIADWYGIKNIICSDTTVDVFSHKVIQATMGAISRVKVHYCSLSNFLCKDWGLPIYGTFLEGENIYSESLDEAGFVIFGNEGKGISEVLSKFVTKKLLIPSYPIGALTSESLNVGVATAITISEFRKRKFLSK